MLDMQSVENTAPTPSRRRFMYVPKVDFYGPVHKGVRWALARLLSSIGSTSPGNKTEVVMVLADIDELLVAIASHLSHEEHFVHPAIEARRPGATTRLEDEHREHESAAQGIRVLLDAIRTGSPDTRPALWRALYLRFADFTAENIRHMAEEEEVMQPLLEELYTTAELEELHGRLLAAIPPEEMAVFARFMLPANDFEFRLKMLEDARAAMPASAFVGMFAAATVNLAPDEISKLADRLVGRDAE